MNVFLFGSTGATGKEILKRLVRDKHTIKIIVRDPSSVDLQGLNTAEKQVDIIKGDVLDNALLLQHLKECNIVISALGTGKDNSYTEVYSHGGKNILSAMRKNGIRKLITVTSGLIDMSDPGTDNFFINRIIRPNYNKIYYDQTRWETILDETTDIDWICVRPTNLVNKPFTGKYRVNLNHCPKSGWKISRADLADFIVKQTDSDQYVHKKPVIAY